MCTVAAASGAASVRVWHIMSRGWDPWTERPLPEGVRVAYPPNVRFLTIEQVDQEARKSGGRAPTRTPVKRDGVTYDFNLSVIGYIVYEFKSPDGKSEGTGAVPVGMKDGRYFVTTRVPLP